MNWQRGQYDEHDPIAEALRDRVPVPDQTRAIMGRLGYMRVGEAVARRHRRMALARRLACLLLMAGAVGVGYTWYQSAGDIRRADDITLPSAFAGQIEQRGAALTGFLESIRPIEPVMLSETVPAQDDAAQDPHTVEPADPPQPSDVGPVQEDDGGDLPMISVPDGEVPANVAIAPFRWT